VKRGPEGGEGGGGGAVRGSGGWTGNTYQTVLSPATAGFATPRLRPAAGIIREAERGADGEHRETGR
jgi:hypothetical protein